MADKGKQLYWSLCYYGFLLLFLLGTMAVNILVQLIMVFITKQRSKSILRWASYHMFNIYLVLMESSGALRTNRNVLDKLNSAEGGLLIISNHPSLLDAPILFSKIHGLLCVFKSSLSKSLWIGRTASTIGHLSNDGGLDLIRNLSDKLKDGEKVLLFPEGTRTVSDSIDSFNPGYALAAIRSKVPLQILKIHSDSPILSKKQSKFRTTRFPCTFLIEQGPVVEPDQFNTVREFNRRVEDWYREKASDLQPGKIQYLPAITNRIEKTDTFTIEFTVPENPFYCQGHMPGNPIVPGYVHMAWLREILEMLREIDTVHLRHFRWKFLKPVLPGDRIRITITKNNNRNKVAVTRAGESVSQGLFSCEGTGAK